MFNIIPYALSVWMDSLEETSDSKVESYDQIDTLEPATHATSVSSH